MKNIILFIRSKRLDRMLLWLAFTVLTLMTLLYVWTNWSGRRRWAATKDRVVREGETLDFRTLLPETPPEAKNLLAIEPLRGIAAVVENDDSKGEPGTRRKDLDRMRWSSDKLPASSGVYLGKADDFQEWAKFLRDIKYVDLPAATAAAPTATGREVLTALDAKFPLLKQLADEAVNRPLAMLTPGLRERAMPEMLFSLRVPHYPALQTLGKALGLRVRAAVAAGASTEAARSVVVIHRLATACEQEPLLIGFLVGGNVEMQALEQLWLGLRERAFAEADLRLLQDAFAADQTAGALLQAMRGEMAASTNAVEYLQLAANGRKTMGPDLRDAVLSSEMPGGIYLWRIVPGGLFDHWKSVAVELELQHLIQPLKNGGLRESVRRSEEIATTLKQNSSVLRHPDHIIARLILPSVSMVSSHALMLDARRQQALAALALERFFVKHARYPAALAELTPEFLPAIPNDPCDGKPLRYRTTPAGRYQLWSVGFDGKDDAGKVIVGTKGAAKLNKREYVGDWSWGYEPVE